MSKINYEAIYNKNREDWKELTNNPQKYEALLAGHYSDSNHFVYELIQNAEDAQATKAMIEYYEDKLVFYHDGTPFNEYDVRGVSSMLMGTKEKNDAQTIGRFGMGFKSVFKYTDRPEIYSDDEAFVVENYLLPKTLGSVWDCTQEKCTISYKSRNKNLITPFRVSKNLTKIVIPFFKTGKNGQAEKIDGSDVLIKLRDLSGEILLFLTNIKKLCWIDKSTEEGAEISIKTEQNDSKLKICSIRPLEAEKEDLTYYLKYSKVFDHKEMKSAEVSVAYKVNRNANNINDIENGSDICVYFPTKDKTDLPFLIHGSFETAVSREKLMAPSSFNDDLFDILGDLIANSMIDLRNRKLITQNFIRRVLLVAFEDENNNDTIPGLKEKVSDMFRENALLPGIDGRYHECKEVMLPAPFGITDFYNKTFFKDSLKERNFVVFNDNKSARFRDYYIWLTAELGVEVYTLAHWAKDLQKVNNFSSFNISDFEDFYKFLKENRDSNRNTPYSYWSRSYEDKIIENLSETWEMLRQTRVIVDAENKLSAAYNGSEELIYLNSSSAYKKVSSIVHPQITEKYSDLLREDFRISEFDDFQYVKEKVIKKYIDVDHINFGDENNYEAEYIEDIQQIIKLLDNPLRTEDVVNLLKDAYIIKIKDKDEDTNTFSCPSDAYVDISDEGVDMRVLFEPIFADDPDKIDDFNKYNIDTDFFDKYNISIDKLKKFGLYTTPVTKGYNYGKQGNTNWYAEGKYCPELKVHSGEENLVFISKYHEQDIAKKKSFHILKLLLYYADVLSGKIKYGITNPRFEYEETEILRIAKECKWIYGKDGKMYSPDEISKYDLDTSIYGELSDNKEAYTYIGFIEKEQDIAANTFEMVDALNMKNKEILFRQLARELGIEYKTNEKDQTQYSESEIDYNSQIFNVANDWSDEFPVHNIKNMDSLIEHVRQQFYCADPVKYEKVLRQIRTSNSNQIIRAYALGMYTNESNNHICQMCKEITEEPEIVEISNYGIELSQFHMCFCRNCAAKYKKMRDSNRESFKKKIRNEILSAKLEDDECVIDIDSERTISFTQTHIAEMQILFDLIEKNGLPDKN